MFYINWEYISTVVKYMLFFNTNITHTLWSYENPQLLLISLCFIF